MLESELKVLPPWHPCQLRLQVLDEVAGTVLLGELGGWSPMLFPSAAPPSLVQGAFCGVSSSAQTPIGLFWCSPGRCWCLHHRRTSGPSLSAPSSSERGSLWTQRLRLWLLTTNGVILQSASSDCSQTGPGQTAGHTQWGSNPKVPAQLQLRCEALAKSGQLRRAPLPVSVWHWQHQNRRCERSQTKWGSCYTSRFAPHLFVHHVQRSSVLPMASHRWHRLKCHKKL